MAETFNATEIEVGFHPGGFSIDKTAPPLNRYTRWQIITPDKWYNPKPICFHSLPQEGWLKNRKFDWDQINKDKEVCLK